MELGNISQPVYGPGPQAPASSTPGLVAMVHGFLRLVQPNALPVGGCSGRGGWRSGGGATRGCSVPMLLYELGFLVCVAIGLLFIILVPLVGCCFCCCRC
ncbi:PRM1A protein, partial [Geococcyx californianus]|nr:PRM1A protein [Geococcyx californianus]